MLGRLNFLRYNNPRWDFEEENKMLRVFLEERWCTAAMLVFFFIAIALKFFIGLLYETLIRESENMAVTQNAILKRWKTKFIKCFQLNGGVNNVAVFVDKCISHLTVGRLSFARIEHYSGQAQLFSVIMAGIGICRLLAGGTRPVEIIPFYLACLLELYLYFSVTAAVNIKERQRILKIQMVDYLENHLSARVKTTQKDLENLGYIAPKDKVDDNPSDVQTQLKKTVNTLKMNEKLDIMSKMSEKPDMDLVSGSPAMAEEWEELIREILTI